MLENARERTPYFWMFVREAGEGHAYAQLMREYRRRPETLAACLPHRDIQDIRRLARSLAIVTWRDLVRAVLSDFAGDDATRSLKQELWRRIA